MDDIEYRWVTLTPENYADQISSLQSKGWVVVVVREGKLIGGGDALSTVWMRQREPASPAREE